MAMSAATKCVGSLVNVGHRIKHASLRTIDSLETELLGREGLSFAIAAERVDWVPEPLDSSCWRCGLSVGPFETDGDGCSSCRGTKLQWDRSIRMGLYEGIIRDAIIDLKFRRWILSGSQLGAQFGSQIGEQLASMGLNPEEVLIVPVPITHRRRIKRGVDHTGVLAQGVSKTSGIRVARLLKARNRAEQIGLSATARSHNVRGAFFADLAAVDRVFKKSIDGAANPDKSSVRAILILDDVRTTGSTLGEACKTLAKALKAYSAVNSVEIWAASIALANGERKPGPI
ncbi:MAG: ComF family protein [Phycisphaerales bacterium]